MQIKTINIRRRESYDRATKEEFVGNIELVGGNPYPADIKIGIPVDMLEPIVGIIAQAAAEAMSGATKAFHEDVKAMIAGPAIEQVAITDQAEPA